MAFMNELEEENHRLRKMCVDEEKFNANVIFRRCRQKLAVAQARGAAAQGVEFGRVSLDHGRPNKFERTRRGFRTSISSV